MKKGEKKYEGNFKMIMNTKLFKELQEKPEWETLFSDKEGTLKDKRIPILAGGLDHIERNDWEIYFYDRGIIRGTEYIDNSFGIVRGEKFGF